MSKEFKILTLTRHLQLGDTEGQIHAPTNNDIRIALAPR